MRMVLFSLRPSPSFGGLGQKDCNKSELKAEVNYFSKGTLGVQHICIGDCANGPRLWQNHQSLVKHPQWLFVGVWWALEP